MPAEHSISKVARSAVWLEQLGPVHGHRPRLQLGGLPPPRRAVGALAPHLHRREGGRALHQLAGGQLEPLGHPARLLELAVAVARCPSASRAGPPRGRSSAGPCRKRCARVARPTSTSSSPVANGIERAGVADLRAPLEPAANAGHDVVGGDAGGLGVEQDPRRGHSASCSSDLAAQPFHQLRIGHARCVKPAACVWPPPPYVAGDPRHVHASVGGPEAHLAHAAAVLARAARARARPPPCPGRRAGGRSRPPSRSRARPVSS